MASKIDLAIEYALKRVPPDPMPHGSVESRYMEILGSSMEKGERVLITARQSRFEAITPKMIVATNKKIIILTPSFWKLYMGNNVLGPSQTNFIPYTTLRNVNFSRGRLLCSLSMKALGVGELIITGLKFAESKLLLDFLENIVEYSEA